MSSNPPSPPPPPRVVACIPAFNEEMSIAKVVVGAMKHVNDVIVCNDGSTDMTEQIARVLGAEVISHERRQGYGASLADLFLRARETEASVVVTIDGDGQHDPDDIPKLVKPILDGEADITIGSRFLGGKDETPAGRKVGIKVITGITNGAGGKNGTAVSDAQSGLRAYSKSALEQVTPTETGMSASTQILLKAKESGLRIVEVPIKVDYKNGSTSSAKSFGQGFSVVLGTLRYLSISHPLIFYGIPGFAATLAAIVFWFWTLNEFARTQAIVTNVALMAVGATIVGLMFLLVAVVLWVTMSLIREEDAKWEKRIKSMPS